MAIMYPEKCDINEIDREYQIFEALKLLDDNYRVFHSFNSVYINKKRHIEEHEIDFVIFHPEKGILVIEAKNGRNISYDPKTDIWQYASKNLIHGGKGPFEQVRKNERFLRNLLNSEFSGNLQCKFVYAVWFHAMEQKQINMLPILKSEKELILPQEALGNPQEYIERMFSYDDFRQTNLNPNTVRVIENMLAAEFEVEAGAYSGMNYNKYIFKRLSQEQARVLDFLDEQKFAAINGAAGTGKTFVALEKAKKCANQGENVLFLCFTRELRDRLANENKNYPLIDIKTIDKLAFDLGATKINQKGKVIADMQALINKIQTDEFASRYKNIIIDEAQDFGQARMDYDVISDDLVEEKNVINALHDVTLAQDGTFYLFYDKNQQILSEKLPQYIQDAECKITLHKNCRNTKQIAITSGKVLKDFKVNVYEHYVDDKYPELYIEKDFNKRIQILDKIIADFKANVSKDIVILSCKSMHKTELAPYLKEFIIPKSPKNDYEKKVFRYKNETPFYTCGAFKGAEADAVILVDIEKTHITDEAKKLNFYTGASRARFALAYICDFSEDDCKDVLKSISKKPIDEYLPLQVSFADEMQSELKILS